MLHYAGGKEHENIFSVGGNDVLTQALRTAVYKGTSQ